VELPSTLKLIDYKGFADCEALAEVDLAAATRLTEIGPVAFRRCALTAVRLPDSLTRLGTSAFRGCTKLTSVTLPPLVRIGWLTFDGCTALSAINFAAGLKEIGYRAFGGCTALVASCCPRA
jgi:hypothetical protein